MIARIVTACFGWLIGPLVARDSKPARVFLSVEELEVRAVPTTFWWVGPNLDPAPPEAITPILGTYSLCQLLAAPFWGNLSDAYGRRAILMTSLAGACVSYAILGFASNLGWLLVSRVLAGFMAGNIAAAFAYAADVSTPQNRAAALRLPPGSPQRRRAAA